MKMALLHTLIVIVACNVVVQAQRPFYAGLRPIGYPLTQSDTLPQLSNRFGENAPVPIETKGDRNFINRIERLPIDYRPFWYINWRQYNALRQRPQSWPQRPNNFINK